MVAWIGTSGWSYDHWMPELYPPGLPPAARLGRYCESFPTVELNSSFYRWPPAGGLPELAAAAAARLPHVRHDGAANAVRDARALRAMLSG
jgi:uncharacterized protein YecE (DUF72 family)